MTQDFNERIQAANRELQDAMLKVRIERVGNKLHLRATLPPKPDSVRDDWHQQRISIGKPANQSGLLSAKKIALIVGGRLVEGTFSWDSYVKARKKTEKVGDWIERFEQEVKRQVEPVTWRTDYRNAFSKLPSEAPLTAKLLKDVAEKTKEDSRTRKRCVQAFSQLARFAGIEVDLQNLKGKYSATAVEPRDLPTDPQIVEHFNSLVHPGWRWVFGMLATFGLRNHEVFYLDVEPLVAGKYYIRVLEGKTRGRLVWAFYPEWVDEFSLRTKTLPPVNGKTHEDYGRRVTQFFQRTLPFAAYNLRHRWAIRTLEFGVEPIVSAKQMGHSLEVHQQTYHRWITTDVYERVYERVLGRSDRPTPPLSSALQPIQELDWMV